jgi:hypothetical protein
MEFEGGKRHSTPTHESSGLNPYKQRLHVNPSELIFIHPIFHSDGFFLLSCQPANGSKRDGAIESLTFTFPNVALCRNQLTRRRKEVFYISVVNFFSFIALAGENKQKHESKTERKHREAQ